MAQTREIKKRMVAVKNIQRITKTMQMIATARFTAALQRAKQTQPYTQRIRDLVAEVAAAAGEVEHPLINGPSTSPNRELMLVITSDRGLAGAYNANVLRKAMETYRAIEATGRRVDLHVSGKKGLGFFRFQRLEVSEKFTFGDKPAYSDVDALAERYIDAFTAGRYDAVTVVFTRYISNARQTPEALPLLPLSRPEPEAAPARDLMAGPGGGAYEFSPSAEALLEDLLPLTVKTTLFQAFNDAVVSEQIMRMVAMKAATENAGEIGRGLKRQFNRARQTQITTELMEIIAGAAALE